MLDFHVFKVGIITLKHGKESVARYLCLLSYISTSRCPCIIHVVFQERFN